MKFNETLLEGAYVIELDPFEDNRGVFVRLFCKKEFGDRNLKTEFVQTNYSLTKNKGAIRGMHFQFPPKAETKIVKCLRGSVFDVIVDLRKDSPTFLKWHGEELSEKNNKAVYIPKGFAHGFQTLEDNCGLIYFHDEFYSKEAEGGISPSDQKINIKWPLELTEISEKDKNRPLLDKNFQGIEI